MKKVGQPQFEKLFYQNKPIAFDDLRFTTKSGVQTIYFSHLYLGMMIFGERTHACLRLGVWCWSDLLEHPRDAYEFITRRIRAWTLSR